MFQVGDRVKLNTELLNETDLRHYYQSYGFNERRIFVVAGVHKSTESIELIKLRIVDYNWFYALHFKPAGPKKTGFGKFIERIENEPSV